MYVFLCCHLCRTMLLSSSRNSVIGDLVLLMSSSLVRNNEKAAPVAA